MSVSDRRPATPAAPDSGAPTGGSPYALLAMVSLGALLAPLNSTMLAVALPEIRADFGVSHAALGWLISAYLIAMAVVQPVAGRLGDQIGRARVFRISLVAFLVCSVLAAASPNFLSLVLLRTGQAVAGASLMPNGMALLRVATPTERLGRMNGLNGSIMSVSAASGPLVGAALLAFGSWRLLFVLNVPVVALALLIAMSSRYDDSGPRSAPRVDIVGITLSAGLLLTITLLLNGNAGAPSSLPFIGTLAATIGLGLLLFFTQRRTPTPVAEWSLFRTPSFAGATIYVLVTNLVMYTTLLAVPFFITDFQGRSASTTGLLLGVMSVGMAVMAPLGGTLSDAVGRRLPALVGAAAALAGALAILLLLDEDTGFPPLAASLALLGLGIGLGAGPATTAAIESAPIEAAGRASGTNSMMRYAGSILGAGMLAGVLDTDAAVPDLDTFRVVFVIVVAMAAIAIATAIPIHRFPPQTQTSQSRDRSS